MTPASLTIVMFGIVGMLVLGYFAKTMFAQKEKPAAPPLREVPMAIADIPPGTVVTADHLGMGRADRASLTADVLLVNRVIVGRVARDYIKAATPIKAGQLYQPGEQPPLDIGPQMRAVSVEVGDGVAVVDGLIKPGDTVDVLFTAQTGGSATDTTYQGGLTMRLFEGVKVLAINRNFSQGRVDRGNNHVTLELTVAQTNIIVLAKERGKITLTYNPNGKGSGGLALSNAERVTLYEMLGLEKAEPAKEPYLTEVFRGASRTKNQFDEKGRLIDSSNGNQGSNNPNSSLQLPNTIVPGGPRTASNPSPDNAIQPSVAPKQDAVSSRIINPALPTLNDQPQRSAPTAQIIQRRN